MIINSSRNTVERILLMITSLYHTHQAYIISYKSYFTVCSKLYLISQNMDKTFLF